MASQTFPARARQARRAPVCGQPAHRSEPAAGPGIGLGAGPALVELFIVIRRLVNEETVLRRELPGYAAYIEQVRFRLVPGLWSCEAPAQRSSGPPPPAEF